MRGKARRVSVLLGLLLFSAPAHATPEAAHRYYLEGVRLVEKHDFAGAKEAFEQAYRESPHYVVLYNLGRVSMDLGDETAAAEYLKRYLEEGGERISVEQRRDVELLLGELTSRAIVAPAPTPPAASGTPTIAVAERPPAATSLPRSLAANAPATAAKMSRPPNQTSGSRHLQEGLAIGLGAAGLAVLASTAALAIWNAGRYDDWETQRSELEADPPPRSIATDADIEKLASYQYSLGKSDAELRAIKNVDAMTWTGLALGGVLLGVGVTLHLTLPRLAQQGALRVAPLARTVELSLRF